MDPLSRKLFQSRDAREKLRQQGGIMASSPELAQTVAKFANGGPTELQIPRVRSAIQEGGMSYPSYRMLSRGQKRELGYPVSDIGGQLAFDRFSVGLGLVDRDARFTPSGPVREPDAPVSSGRITSDELIRKTQPVTIDRMGNLQTVYVDMESGKIYDPSGQDFNLLLSPKEYSDLEDRVNQTLVSQMGAERRTLEKEADIAQSRFENAPSGEALDEVRRTREAVSEAPEAPVVERDAVERVLSRPSGSFETRDVFAEEGPGASDLSGQVTPPPVAPSPAAPEETPEKKDEGGGDGDGGGDGGGDNGGADDFNTTYEQMLSRLEGIMGKEADEDKKKKAMANLAMIGLAIAAGQSPDALTNIAQGALVGMQGIQKAEAEKDRSARDLRLEALKMAQEEVNLSRRLKNAKDIAAMRAAGGSGSFSPQDRLYNATFATVLEETGSIDEAQAAARRAAPGASLVTGAGTGVGVGFSDLPEVTTREQYDALPPGAMFIQNGQQRRKPAQ